MSELPFLPYAGTSGWSGSVTSLERAKDNDKSGKTMANQKTTLCLLYDYGFVGLTWKELSEITNQHHGSASGVLSVLHKGGFIMRLKETRNRCAIYVHPNYVLERAVVERKKRECKNCGHKL